PDRAPPFPLGHLLLVEGHQTLAETADEREQADELGAAAERLLCSVLLPRQAPREQRGEEEIGRRGKQRRRAVDQGVSEKGPVVHRAAHPPPSRVRVAA